MTQSVVRKVREYLLDTPWITADGKIPVEATYRDIVTHQVVLRPCGSNRGSGDEIDVDGEPAGTDYLISNPRPRRGSSGRHLVLESVDIGLQGGERGSQFVRKVGAQPVADGICDRYRELAGCDSCCRAREFLYGLRYAPDEEPGDGPCCC